MFRHPAIIQRQNAKRDPNIVSVVLIFLCVMLRMIRSNILFTSLSPNYHEHNYDNNNCCKSCVSVNAGGHLQRVFR